MFNVHTIPKISIAMMVLGSIFGVIALSTEYWGKLDPTSVRAFSPKTLSGNWGMFRVCLKSVVSGQIVQVQSECKSPDSYPQYWNATLAFEILALVCSLIPIPVWCIWVFFPKPTEFPWLKIMKIVTITFVCLTAFFHSVAVSVWSAKDEGPEEVKQRGFRVRTGFSWGFAIFCIIWQILIMVPMQMSLPRYKRNKVVKQPTHPLFRPDPEGGGIVIPEDVESSKPNIFPTASRSFLDSLPDERNVYVYDEEEGAIKPKTVSRNTGSRVAQMMGNTWGKQPAAKSKLQMLKETWGKRNTFKFGLGTRSKASGAEQNDTVSKITGEPTQSTSTGELKADNSVPLFVKSLWNTHFKKDEIRDNYEIESDNRVTKRWEAETSEGAVGSNFSWKRESSERKDYNDDDYGEVEEIDDDDVASDEEDENEGKVYNIPSSSEDDGDAERVVTVPNPNIVYEKKIVERKNFNVPGYEGGTDILDHEHENVPSQEPNFSFEKKVIERRNYNDVSSAEEEDEDINDNPVVTNRSAKRQAPGIPVTKESSHLHRGMSDDRSSVSDEMYTYSYEEGLDTCGTSHSPTTPRTPTDEVMVNPLQFIPSVKLEVDMNNVPNMPNESSDGADGNSWARPYEDNSTTNGKHDYENFAYLHDMSDSEHNVTEI